MTAQDFCQNFSRNADIFLQQLFKKCDEAQVQLKPHWLIDHLCYRVPSTDLYLKNKKSFSQLGTLLIESEINGRPISTYKLHTPLKFRHYSIELVELPAPKPGKLNLHGFEHAEIVCDSSFEEIKRMFPNCQFDESGLKKAINPELEITFGELALKFHHQSLEQVIKLELAT